jgi:hypothetical protein
MEMAGLTLTALKSGVVLLGDDLTFEEKLTVPIWAARSRLEALRLPGPLPPHPPPAAPAC